MTLSRAEGAAAAHTTRLVAVHRHRLRVTKSRRWRGAGLGSHPIGGVGQMKGISRRTRTCAAIALAGAAALATAGAAHAGPNDKWGDGAPTGQSGVQLFNYGTYL